MLDVKLIIDNPEEIVNRLKTRNADYSESIKAILALDGERKEYIKKSEALKNERNTSSKMVGQYKKEGKNADEIMERVRVIGDEIKGLDDQLAEIETKMRDILLNIPNMPHASVPVGKDEQANAELYRKGIPKTFDFKVRDHVDLAEKGGHLDTERAVKIAESRFSILKGELAQLERALISFMLDIQTREHGYTECCVPYMVNRKAMTGTGQLPKFEEDMYALKNDDLYLISTAEIPLTNYYADEILNEDDLPINMTAYTACFRREAGTYGKDTRGLIRQHQFDKVELVKFAHPDRSYDELDTLRLHAEKILELLDLPYRVMTLSTGDMGFSSAKTYDLEVWLPAQNCYREISSCSNFEDFQARRANIRFKDKNGKNRFVHTINGSGLAVGRTLVAVLENYQNEDGSITVPEVLRPYLHGKTAILKS